MTYKLKQLDFVTSHWPSHLLLVRDGPKHDHDKTELRAQVASEDYFAMLATKLDQVSQALSDSQKSDYIILEDAISDLLYLHQFYKIVKK